MTAALYDAARNELICQLQDIMDEMAPPVYSNSSGDDSSEDEEDLPLHRILMTTKHWQMIIHLTII